MHMKPNMKKGTVLIVSFLIMIVLALGGIHFVLEHFTYRNVDADLTQSTSTKDYQIKQAKSKYPGIDILSIVQENENYIIHKQTPEFKSNQLNDLVDNFFDKPLSEFREAMAEAEPVDDPVVMPSFHAWFDIYPFAENLYAIVLNIEQNYGAANPERLTQPYMIDIEQESLLHTEDYFDSDQLEAFKEMVWNKLNADEALAPYLFQDEYELYLADVNLAKLGYFTNEGLEIIFNPYTIAAGAAGTPTVSLAYDEIIDFLTEEGIEEIAQSNPDLHLTELREAKEPKPVPENMPSVITHNPDAGKKVALTFDDGPHATNTPAILDVLDEYDAKATFFMLGKSAQFYPELVNQVAMAGHEIGNHTMTHRQLTTLDEWSIQQEISQVDDVIEQAVGYQPNLMRPPYGAHDEYVDRIVNKPMVLWSIDTRDWQSHDPNAVLNIVTQNIHDGAIILMHDIHGETVEATRLVLDYLASEGYEFVTVSELFV